MRKHFVIFFSPGTFVAESTQKPIDSWDVQTATDMARTITERYNATPYGFCFVTRSREDNDLDSREVARSKMYFLGGEILTLEQVTARNYPDERILVRNMKNNGWNRIVVNTNSWKWTQPLDDGDTVLEWKP